MDPNGWFHKAIMAHQAGRLLEAVAAYDKTIRLAPRHFQAHGNRGVALLDLGRPSEALVSFDRAVALSGKDAVAHNNRGNALRALKRSLDALSSYDRAIALVANQPLFHLNRGSALFDLERYAEALASCDAALALQSDNAMAHNNRGNALRSLGRLEEALASCSRAIELAPRYWEAHYNLGKAASDLDRHDAALAAYDKALALNPRFYDAHCNRGNVLRKLRRFREAFTAYDAAVAIDPGRGEAYLNRGIAQRETGWFDDALADFDRALKTSVAPDDIYEQRAVALFQLGRHDDAVAAIERIDAASPGHGRTRGLRLYCKTMSCDWSGFDADVAELADLVERDVPATTPFFTLALVDDPALHLKAARMYQERNFPDSGRVCPPRNRGADEPIRVGYFSADFREHPVMHVLLDTLESHDRKRFELFAFSMGPDTKDVENKRAKAAFDSYFDIRLMSDREVADKARQLGIDIAVDCMGHTSGSRMGIFAERAAPVQVNFLGYPGTMAAPYFDYIVGDPNLVVPAERANYTENVVRMPHTYLPNARFRELPQMGTTRADAGLPASGFVFAAFNNAYKITPGTFRAWMRILAGAQGSVLWLAMDRPRGQACLAAEAARCGVDPARLVFASRVPSIDAHFDRLRLADLFLDTSPYNAHTTASDFLRVGVPVLTCPGRSFASRVAAGILSTVGIPELIADSLDEYEALAIGLAQDRPRHDALRTKLRASLPAAPLFDSEAYARNLERAYIEMDGRIRRGEPAADIILDAG